MKKLITVIFLLFCASIWGQLDTLEFTNRRKIADTLFGLLNEQYYGGSLIDRSLTEDSLLIQQINGDYTGTANGWSWLQAYSDLALSCTDPTKMLSDSLLQNNLITSYQVYEKTSDEEKIIQPFGLLIHEVSKIDTYLYHVNGMFSNQQGQLKLSPTINERTIYRKLLIKEAALLELYGEHGYQKGVVKYNPDFISVGDNIEINQIQLNVGQGFQDFSETNNSLSYEIYTDWQIGRAAIDYTISGITQKDTLSFYLTTKIYKYSRNSDEKKVHRWDVKGLKYPQNGDADLKYAIRYGCGNGTKIRRPIIIAPPYRPAIQSVSFRKYYNQFNFKSLISSLSEMGYDVIFIKETPGNRGIDHAGNILASFLKYINTKKKTNYPNEDWENTVIGFSAGGQHWRWALKKLEKEHMETGTPHHHTRLYIPFDSPHWGVNVPMFAQSVFKDFKQTGNIFAALAYNALTDAASKDMQMNHIISSNLTASGNNDFYLTPGPTTEKTLVDYQMMNSFNHQFTPLNDLRRSFPTFTRNVAVSVGSSITNYTTQYNLTPGMNLFSQNFGIPTFWGFKHINREIDASWYINASTVFYREDIRMIAFIIPIITQHRYLTNWAYEWDMAQSSYKDEFYNHLWYSPIAVMRWGAFGLGTTHYKNGHMSFMPMVSSLGINPSIWQNNNLYYNVKNEGLMFNQFNSNVPSNTFGYPNLGHPNNHFNITPFEAIYCDPQTYEHIKMQESSDDNGLDDTYLVYTRNFILDEVEADVVCLQNKVIGKNHVQWDPNYLYKAWYKAKDKIIIGSHVTPKTDQGAYIIEKTGDITVYACNEIKLESGFHAEAGSRFHAYIQCDDCSRPRNKNIGNDNSDDKKRTNTIASKVVWNEEKNQSGQQVLKVYPNPTNGSFTVVFPENEAGKYVVVDLNGKCLYREEIAIGARQKIMRLPKGMYIIQWLGNKKILTQKLVVL